MQFSFFLYSDGGRVGQSGLRSWLDCPSKGLGRTEPYEKQVKLSELGYRSDKAV